MSQIRAAIAVGDDGGAGVVGAQRLETAQFFLAAPILALQAAVEPIAVPDNLGTYGALKPNNRPIRGTYKSGLADNSTR